MAIFRFQVSFRPASAQPKVKASKKYAAKWPQSKPCIQGANCWKNGSQLPRSSPVWDERQKITPIHITEGSHRIIVFIDFSTGHKETVIKPVYAFMPRVHPFPYMFSRACPVPHAGLTVPRSLRLYCRQTTALQAIPTVCVRFSECCSSPGEWTGPTC